MKKSTQVALISVAVVVGLTAIVATGVLFLRVFSDVLHFENDSSDAVTITLLLENHDDNRFYLFDDRTITPYSTEKISLGFDNIRCIYIGSEQENGGYVFSDNAINKTTEPPFENTFVKLSDVETQPSCPREKSFFPYGVNDGIYLNRNWDIR